MNFEELTPYDYFLSPSGERLKFDEVESFINSHNSSDISDEMKKYYENILNRNNVKTFLIDTDSEDNMNYIKESLESYFDDVGTILNYSYKLLKKYKKEGVEHIVLGSSFGARNKEFPVDHWLKYILKNYSFFETYKYSYFGLKKYLDDKNYYDKDHLLGILKDVNNILKSRGKDSITLKTLGDMCLYNIESIEAMKEMNNWYNGSFSFIEENPQSPHCNLKLIMSFFYPEEKEERMISMITLNTSENMEINDRKYATIIGITASVPYFFAKLVNRNLPTVTSTMIPYVINYCRNNDINYIFVNPTVQMGKMLRNMYGFCMINMTSEPKNLFGCDSTNQGFHIHRYTVMEEVPERYYVAYQGYIEKDELFFYNFFDKIYNSYNDAKKQLNRIRKKIIL